MPKKPSKPRKKKAPKGYIRCDNELAQMLPEETQLDISEVICQVYFSLVTDGIPGVLIYSIPNDDGTSEISINSYQGVQDVIRAALLSNFKDVNKLKELMKRFNIERKLKDTEEE